jgi:hypothetical protein
MLATVALLVLLLVAGLLLPKDWQVERSVVVGAPASAVFPYLNSLKRWREWTVWYAREPDLQVEYEGPESGVGATSRWQGRDGRGAMKILNSDRDRRVEYLLLLDAGATEMNGLLQLTPEAGGTRVTWRVGGSVGGSPLQRYFALLISVWVGHDIDASLAQLKTKLEAR